MQQKLINIRYLKEENPIKFIECLPYILQNKVVAELGKLGIDKNMLNNVISYNNATINNIISNKVKIPNVVIGGILYLTGRHIYNKISQGIENNDL